MGALILGGWVPQNPSAPPPPLNNKVRLGDKGVLLSQRLSVMAYREI